MMDEKEVKILCDEAWQYLSALLNMEEVSGANAASVMLTITARYWASICKDTSRQSLEFLKEAFITVMDEKLLDKND